MLIVLLLAAMPLQTQADLNAQAGAAKFRADGAMNAQYRATMDAMRAKDALHEPDAHSAPSYQDALLASKRAWLRFRDAECVVGATSSAVLRPRSWLPCSAWPR